MNNDELVERIAEKIEDKLEEKFERHMGMLLEQHKQEIAGAY